jgi:hypothetical protein
MKHIIFLSLFFGFTSFAAMAYEGAQLPSQAYDADNDLFGSQSSGGTSFDATAGGGSGSGSSSSSNGGGSNGGGGIFDWFSGQTSSSYSAPLQRAVDDGPDDGDSGLEIGGGTPNENEYNDPKPAPAGEGMGILFASSLVYLAFAYRKKRKA